MDQQFDWNSIKLGQSVMLISGSGEMTVIEIIRNEENQITHLTCAWGENRINAKGIEVQKLPIEAVVPFKSVLEQALEKLHSRRN